MKAVRGHAARANPGSGGGLLEGLISAACFAAAAACMRFTTLRDLKMAVT